MVVVLHELHKLSIDNISNSCESKEFPSSLRDFIELLKEKEEKG
jgi:hypothetical protein